MKPKTTKLLTLLSFILFLLSCKDSNTQAEIYQPTPFNTANELNGEIFISDMMVGLNSIDNGYYFIDYKSGALVNTDKDLNFKNSYAKKGRGPSEAVFFLHYAINDNNIFINGNGSVINVFDKKSGDFIRSIEYSDSVGQNIMNRIVVDDKYIIGNFAGAYTAQGKPIVAIDIISGTVKAYEGTIKGETDIQRVNCFRNVHKADNSDIISVLKPYPFIDIYDSNMKLKRTLDISQIDVIKKQIESTEEEKKTDPNSNMSVYSIIHDSYYANGRLYLLCVSRDDNGKRNNAKTIIELDITKSGFKHKRTIILPDKWYYTFCVTDDGKILTIHNVFKSQLEQFKL